MVSRVSRVCLYERIPEEEPDSDLKEPEIRSNRKSVSLDLADPKLSNGERIEKISLNRNVEAITLSSRFSPVREIGSPVISALALKCPFLKSVNLWGCESLRDTDIVLLAKNSPLLTHINLTGVGGITDDSIIALAQHCSRLSEIILTGCKNITDRSFEALRRYDRKLTRLDLSGCPQITERGLGTLTEIGSQLCSLRLDSCNDAVTDQILQQLIERSPYLEILDLSDCHRFTERGIYTLAREGKNLRVVELAGCSIATTEQALCSLLQNCNRIVALNLYSCQQITSRLLDQFVALKSEIKALNIYDCPKIKDFAPIASLASLIYLVIGNSDSEAPLPLPKLSSPKLLVNHIPPGLIRFSEMEF